MHRLAEEKMRATAAQWRKFLGDDTRVKTDHEKSFAMGNIDGLNLALRLLGDPSFDVSSYRSEFDGGSKP